jgi:hypothetical protein
MAFRLSFRLLINCKDVILLAVNFLAEETFRYACNIN